MSRFSEAVRELKAAVGPETKLSITLRPHGYQGRVFECIGWVQGVSVLGPPGAKIVEEELILGAGEPEPPLSEDEYYERLGAEVENYPLGSAGIRRG